VAPTTKACKPRAARASRFKNYCDWKFAIGNSRFEINEAAVKFEKPFPIAPERRGKSQADFETRSIYQASKTPL
jgi:hypothetical protein